MRQYTSIFLCTGPCVWAHPYIQVLLCRLCAHTVGLLNTWNMAAKPRSAAIIIPPPPPLPPPVLEEAKHVIHSQEYSHLPLLPPPLKPEPCMKSRLKGEVRFCWVDLTQLAATPRWASRLKLKRASPQESYLAQTALYVDGFPGNGLLLIFSSVAYFCFTAARRRSVEISQEALFIQRHFPP